MWTGLNFEVSVLKIILILIAFDDHISTFKHFKSEILHIHYSITRVFTSEVPPQ